MSVSEGRAARSPANFCRQAADLVRVRSLSRTRNTRARHFRQKNTHIQILFAKKTSELGPPKSRESTQAGSGRTGLPPAETA